MQQLRDKLAVAERTAKAEAQLKVRFRVLCFLVSVISLVQFLIADHDLITQEKYQLRFKVLEERLKASNGGSRTATEARSVSNGRSRRQSLGGAENFSRLTSNGYLSKRNSNSQVGAQRSNSAIALLKNAKISSNSFDGGSRSLERDKPTPEATVKDNAPSNASDQTEMSKMNGRQDDNANATPIGNSRTEHGDYVSGELYDMLQKEVVTLRKAGHEKDQTLKDKDDAIEVRY